jgi:NADPH:quinone reductase-like Zn-dependent oxidoreductase
MQHWTCRGGSLDNLRLVTSVGTPTLPDDAADFALVEVAFVGLNFADIFACLGLYSATPKGVFTPGLEYSGVIRKLSKKTSTRGFKVGDKIMGVTRFGGYTTHIVADLRYVKKLPAKWSLEEGAAFPAQALTAWYGLVELGAAKPGDVVLLHSAAGGTGLWALQICRHLGVSVIATVGSAIKARELQAMHPWLRPTQIVDRSECLSLDSQRNALRTALDSLNAASCSIVFDSLLGDWFAPSHEFLGPQGRHVVLGAGSMTPPGSSPSWLRLGLQYLKRPRLDPLQMISTNKSVMAFNLIWLYDRVEQVDQLFAALLDCVRAMEGRPHIGHIFQFADLPAALRKLQSGSTVGKVLLKVAI